MSKKPVVLMVLDGYGLNDKTEGNAIAQAKTPVMDGLMKEYPFQPGKASGMDVGLPDGQMGNSEVGHMNIGAGRIIYQDLTRITKSIEDGDFFENKVLLQAVENVKENGSDLHLYGLLSDGGVHSHNTHLYALLELAKRLEGALKLKEISYLHAEGYPSGDMKHGPIALADDELFTIALMPQHMLFDKTKSNIEELAARDATICAISPVDVEVADDWIALGNHASYMEEFFEIMVILQLFALEVSIRLGNDVDMPRNLAKSVTVE